MASPVVRRDHTPQGVLRSLEENALRRGDDCPDEKDLCPIREAFL
jgi:hypothetical protein